MTSKRWLKERLLRFYRIYQYGDTESVSFFETRTPEVLEQRSRGYRWQKMCYIAARLMRALRWTYTAAFKEDCMVRPDSMMFSGEGDYGKFRIGHTYRNAFCLANQISGTISVPIAASDEGLYLYIGRQAVGAMDGELQVTMNDGTPVMCKSVGAISHNWDLYYIHVPRNASGHACDTLDLHWKMSKSRRRVYIATPIIKRAQKERTCLVLVADAITPRSLNPLHGASATPHIDSFFATGMTFPKSYAQSNWTLPSFASMALSQYASDHHVVDPDAYSRAMDRAIPTMAELFRSEGFHTVGSISHRRCNHALGHHRGFDQFEYAQTVESKYGTTDFGGPNNMGLQLRNMCGTLRNIRGTHLFGFMHFFDTHYPFLLGSHAVQYADHALPQSVNAYVEKCYHTELSDDEQRYVQEHYLLKVAALDDYLGELFYQLRNRDNTTVMLISDHGFDMSPQRNQLTPEETETLCMVWSNEFAFHGVPEERVVASCVDLLPTLCSLYGVRDDTPRAGTAIFDAQHTVLPKDYAITELIYLQKYMLKLVTGDASSLVVKGGRDRASATIDLESLAIADRREGQPVSERFDAMMASYIQSSSIHEALKQRITGLLAEKSTARRVA